MGTISIFFSHETLNNRLGLELTQEQLYDNPFVSILDFLIKEDANLMVDYAERIYPPEEYAYRNIVRNRTQFSITDIWDPGDRTKTRTNSQGYSVVEAAWPLREETDWSTALPVLRSSGQDGAGELQNGYSRFGLAGFADVMQNACMYDMRVAVGQDSSGVPVFGGVTKWETATQSGKTPHIDYDIWVHQLRLTAKDYSIVPEFRISEQLDADPDFLTDPLNRDWFLDLTGAHYSSSTVNKFYETYTNADFCKYFNVVDDLLFEKGEGDQQTIRSKISLRCHAAKKFLPYKGFYPAERFLYLGATVLPIIRNIFFRYHDSVRKSSFRAAFCSWYLE